MSSPTADVSCRVAWADDAPAIAARQHAEIAARLGAPIAADAETLHVGALAHLHPMLRLPLAALASPSPFNAWAGASRCAVRAGSQPPAIAATTPRPP